MKKPVIIILHLGYWFLYLLLLTICVGFLVLPKANQMTIFNHQVWLFLVAIAITPGLLGFYFFYTWLFSKFLSRKKIVSLFIYGILVSFIIGLIGELMMSSFFGSVDDENAFMFPSNAVSEIAVLVVITSLIAMLNGGMGLIMKAFITWYGDIKLKEELSRKNYETELELVKSQINPHFLFNTINNIDVLINTDAEKASGYLNKLSDIMRFMLYETKTDHIQLVKELAYIEKYIDLQKIRTSNPNYVNYTVTGVSENFMIAPMLFIPFIENAFKHAENKRVENAINIKLVIEKESVTFECENKYVNIPQSHMEQGGLGNELIKRRLALLYPGKHTLDITDESNTYNIKLVVKRNED